MVQPPLNPGRKYPAVGACIYCGSKQYAADSNQALGLEHIPPEGISGKLELPDAACRLCERTINPWETRLLRVQFLGARTFLKLDSKRPKNRPNKSPLFDTRTTPNRKVMVDLDDCPIFIMQAVYDDACALSKMPIELAASKIWIHFFREPNTLVLARKYNLCSFALSSLDTRALLVTLTKIAHAYLVAEIGLENFVPLLPNVFICDQNHPWFRYYVGGNFAADPPILEYTSRS